MTDQPTDTTDAPAAVLHITDWDDHYEVNSDGRQWEPGQVKRVSRLTYIRAYVFGPAGDNLPYTEAAQAVADKYGPDAWAPAWGLFCKLLEVAGRQKACHRGYLLGRRASPISARMIQTITGFSKGQIDEGLQILLDPIVGWIEEKDFSEMPVSATVGEPRRIQRPSPDSASLSRETNTNTKPNRTRSQLETEFEAREREDPGGSDRPGPGRTADDPGSNGCGNGQQEISLDIDSGTDSDSKMTVTEHRKLFLVLKAYLWSSDATQKQMNGDYTCLSKITEAVASGLLGPAHLIMAKCLDRAKHINGLAGNKMAMFSKWFNDQLPDDMTIRDLPDGAVVGDR